MPTNYEIYEQYAPIKEIWLDSGRWTSYYEYIYQVDGKYYSVAFTKGLTELQEDYLPDSEEEATEVWPYKTVSTSYAVSYLSELPEYTPSITTASLEDYNSIAINPVDFSTDLPIDEIIEYLEKISPAFMNDEGYPQAALKLFKDIKDLQ